MVVVTLLLGLAAPVFAQAEGQIETIDGRVQPGNPVWITVPDLEPGQKLYVYVETTSGNLDPFIALADVALDRAALEETFNQQVLQSIVLGEDPLEVVPQVADEFFLAWDDDDGEGYAAAFEYIISGKGDHQLLLISSPFNASSGDFRLTVGIDAPQVLTGTAGPTGDTIVEVQRDSTLTAPSIQEVGGILEDTRSSFHGLNDLKAGDTVYAFIETTSGDLAPILQLVDFGGKTLASGNFEGSAQQAILQYTFAEDARNYVIRINRGTAGIDELTSGDYRLQVGVNAPEVLTGTALVNSLALLKAPIDVKVGIQMDQITGVDQKSENFGVAASLRMDWTDPRYAFSPDECDCEFKTLTGSAFTSFISNNGLTWPEFILFNQQGRRDTQSQVVVIRPDGTTIYFERFSATLQAPDFDFTLFPFDKQKFFIRVESVFPQSFYQFSENPEYTGLGDQLGEEEWVILDTWTVAEHVTGNARFSFGFEANRHLIFYIVRIFTPILVIIIVSWFTFFLKDYSKRVDVASANLLLFIAFNFTISGDLPKLGYLTFLDVVLVSTFVVTALVVIFNVWLKRLEVANKESVAQTLDKYSIWLYPLLYFGAIAVVTFLFT